MNPRLARWLELAAVFMAAPTLVAFLVPGRWVIPSILALALFCLLALLRDPTFDRKELWNWNGVRTGWRGILIRVAIVGAGMTLALWLWRPDQLFGLPRHRPEIWTIIMFGYPILSAYPQEVAFRAFFRHRYAKLFRSEVTYLTTNACIFGYAHLVMHNPLAIGLSALAGLVLAWSFERTRSCAAIWIEHALYGCLIFTIGWGYWFYGGAVRP